MYFKLNKKPTNLACAIAAIFMSSSSLAAVINVPSDTDLQSAINAAKPGDEIVIASGVNLTSNAKKVHAYPHDTSKRQWSYFQVNDVDGTASNPITIRGNSSNPNNYPTLSGSAFDDGKYIMHFYKSSHWIVKNIRVEGGQKGIILDDSDNNVFDNIEIKDTGHEGFHFRTSSSNNVLKNCKISNTGREQKGYGEAVYVGWHDGHKLNPQDNSNNNRIGGCTFGPNVTAEAFDVKGGTSGTIIEHNTMSGAGGGTNQAPAANSFIDMKGTNVTIRHNTMNANSSAFITHAIQSDDEHRRSNVHNNRINIGASNPTFDAGNNTIHIKNNQRTDGGTVHSSVYGSGVGRITPNSIYGPLNTSAGSAGSYPGFGNAGSGGGSTGSSGGPTGYDYASNERGTVDVVGTMHIAYGANGTFSYLYNRTSDVTCDNSTFGGDPIKGVAKKCYTKAVSSSSNGAPAGFTFASNEHQTVNISGTKDVAYGANGQFHYLYNRTSNVLCKNATFGGDPIRGVAKKCYTRNSN